MIISLDISANKLPSRFGDQPLPVSIDKKFPCFGIGVNPFYRFSSKWAIFHIPTRLLGYEADTKTECKRIISVIAPLGDWNVSEVPSSLLKEAFRAIMNEKEKMRIELKTKKEKK